MQPYPERPVKVPAQRFFKSFWGRRENSTHCRPQDVFTQRLQNDNKTFQGRCWDVILLTGWLGIQMPNILLLGIVFFFFSFWDLIFLLRHSFWVIFVKIWYSGWGYISPRRYSGWGEISPRGPITPPRFGASEIIMRHRVIWANVHLNVTPQVTGHDCVHHDIDRLLIGIVAVCNQCFVVSCTASDQSWSCTKLKTWPRLFYYVLSQWLVLTVDMAHNVPSWAWTPCIYIYI